jgi:hypothetical protein
MNVIPDTSRLATAQPRATPPSDVCIETQCERDIADAARSVFQPIPENWLGGSKPHLCTRSVSDFLRIYDDRLTADSALPCAGPA